MMTIAIHRSCTPQHAGWYVRQGVHFGLFMGALAGQGSDEQRAEWLPKVSFIYII